jgi:carboxypeptidase C (cathepsin A)
MPNCKQLSLALALATAIAAIALGAMTVPGAAQEKPVVSPLGIGEEPSVITHLQVEAEGKLLKYTAEAGRIAIRDVETGQPHAYMFYVAYRVPSPGKPRPVTFLWNGGPGSSATLLHFYVAGPKLVQGGRLVDNAQTWLADSDLVFVDPVGTGFSRPAKPEYAAEFYGTLGDAASVTEFVRCWLLLHNAQGAPVFLVGESYGGPRAAAVSYALEKRGIRVHGAVLISGGNGLNTEYCPPELREALYVADLSATALYHGKTPPELGKDPDAIRKAAEAWGRETYAPALANAEHLSDDERASVLAQLSRFTGLPAAQLDSKTLVVTPRQFLTGLLKDQGKTLQIFDMRRSAPSATDDSVVNQAILHYLRTDLGYRVDLPYVDQGLGSWQEGFAPSGIYPESVNARWNYATAPISPEAYKAIIAEALKRGGGPPRYGPPLPAIQEAIAIDPRMKVLVASGIYDLTTECSLDQEIARRLPPNLKEAMTFKCYVGGHMMYRDAQPRLQLTRDVKALIASSR